MLGRPSRKIEVGVVQRRIRILCHRILNKVSVNALPFSSLYLFHVMYKPPGSNQRRVSSIRKRRRRPSSASC
jgi:hypothetical protein